jgi:hypothetical protein
MPSTVEAVEALAAENVPRFYPSAVAKRLGRDPNDVARDLEPLVERGELAVRFDLVCDTCGATVQTYRPGEVIEGGEVECFATDEPHSVAASRENIWVSYAPTDALRARAGSAPSGPPGGRVAHRKRPKPWASMLRALTPALKRIRSRRSATSRTSRTSTSRSSSNRARGA